MTPDDFEFQLHHEFDWRWNELILLKNTINSVRSESDQCNLRKSLVLTLYSHFEGFCIFSLGHYLLAVNAEQISCKNAVSSIVAGSWELVFRAMETGDEKCRIFSAPLPHDQKLHRHWRRRHFVEEIDKLRDRQLVIPEEVVDSESNLKPSVLQRNLFLLGLDHTFVDPHFDTISNLLGRRNRIAHGEDRRGVAIPEYDKYEAMVFEICVQLIDFLDCSFRGKSFLVA